LFACLIKEDVKMAGEL